MTTTHKKALGSRSYVKPAGFTLLEVLVALIVLSVGLLGLTGLQTTGLSGNHQAMLKSHATVAAAEIIDRMRANRLAALNGEYEIAAADSAPDLPACNIDCAAAVVAERDLAIWRARLATLFPGDEQVAIDIVNDIVTVSIQWSDPKSQDGLTDAYQTVALL